MSWLITFVKNCFLLFVFCFFFETDFRLEKKREKILSNLLTMRYIDDERDPLENKEEKL